MKDGSKTISQRATRFLPVDMKDRLKSAFNRAGAAAENEPAEDGPDYTAIFNPNRAAAAQTNPRVAGASINGGQLADASARNTTRHATQDIEEAEIIAESDGKRPAELSEFSAILKSDKSKAADIKPARRQIEPPSDATAHQDYSLQPEVDAPSDNSKNEGAVSQKSKSRFFGDFSSTESVRLKVEKRNEKRPEDCTDAVECCRRATASARRSDQFSARNAERFRFSHWMTIHPNCRPTAIMQVLMESPLNRRARSRRTSIF